MANLIELRAKAKAAGIDGYKSMSADELTAALAGGGSSASGSKRKSTRKSTRKSVTRKQVTKSVAKASAPAKRKSAARKSAPAKSTTAKRKTTARGSQRTAPNASPRRRVNTDGRRSITPSFSKNAGRNFIDNESVDWDAEWSGGKTGNRKIIFNSLRKHKGDRDKVYASLKGRAREMYPKQQNGRARSEASALSLLTWHISRVAFDFVQATNQHKVSKRNANHQRAQGNAAAPAKRASGRKSKTAARGRQKAAGGRKAASSRRAKTAGRKRKASSRR